MHYGILVYSHNIIFCVIFLGHPQPLRGGGGGARAPQAPPLGLALVSMIRKYHNHKLQTNPWHREEEPHNHHKTPGRPTKQSNKLSVPHQDDCKTRMDIK